MHLLCPVSGREVGSWEKGGSETLLQLGSGAGPPNWEAC